MIAATVFIIAMVMVHAFPTSMYSCDNLPTPGNSLPGDGNRLMHIDFIQPGAGGYCQFSGLPSVATPCQDYEFSVVSSSLKLGQLVSVSNHGTLHAAPGGTRVSIAKTDQCQAVNTVVQNFTYVWRSPATGGPTTFTALCGKMGEVYAAQPVTVQSSDDFSLCFEEPVQTASPAAQENCIVPQADYTGNAQFDYYTLALQWPPGVASKSKDYAAAVCRDDVTLHGLWPSRMVDPYTFPHDCTDVPLVVNDINPSLRKQMVQYWPSLKQPELNGAFWNHEWQVHGTCAVEYPSSYEYFLNALRLHAVFVGQIELLGFFTKFPPTTKSRYRVKDIVSFLGEGSALQCDGDVLTEFRFCLHPETKARQPCPPTMCSCNGTQRVFILPKDCSDPNMASLWPAVLIVALVSLCVPLIYCLVARAQRTRANSKVEGGSYGSPEDDGGDIGIQSLEEEEEDLHAPRPYIQRRYERDAREDDFEI